MRLPLLSEVEILRKKLGWTQTDLAKKASVSQSLIARLEAGTVDPRYSKVAEVFHALESAGEAKVNASKIMTSDVVGIQVSASLEYAASKMKEYSVSQIPVMDGERIVGSFSEQVVLDLISRGFDAKSFSKEDVGSHLEDAFPSIKPETPLTLVSGLLEHNSAVIVQKQGKTLGIITKADLLKVF
jgi:predicted transcriptional regulator